MGNEEILQVRDHENSGDGTMFEMTKDELIEMNGEDGKPLYLAIRGRIYDVSEGRKFYGKGRSYHHFIGRDATRAFATNCKLKACLVSNLDGLSKADKKEIDRWVELYEFHDKYSYVGKLISDDPVDDVVEQAIREEGIIQEIRKYAVEKGIDFVDELVKRGKESYKQREINEAIVLWSAGLTKLGSKTEKASCDGSSSSGNGCDDDGNEEWVNAMIQRSQILGYIAAAVQKRGNIDSEMEAMEHFSESAASMKKVIEQSSASIDSCVLAKVWFMQSSSEADRAAMVLMSANKKKKLKEAEPNELVNGKKNMEDDNDESAAVHEFHQVLQTYKQAYIASLRCPSLVSSIRTGWMNAQLNLAHAYKSINMYANAIESLDKILMNKKNKKDDDDVQNQPTYITNEDAMNSKAMAAILKRSKGLNTYLNKKITNNSINRNQEEL
jgi:predicted heme/steroid binding protein